MEYRVFGSTRNWPLTTARSRTSDQIYHRVKRCTDLVLATLMLVALLPVLLIAAIAIVLDSPGPIIFRQKRVGIHISFHHGKVTYELCEFTLLKFRTMHHHADTLVHQRFVTALIHNDRSRVAAIQAGPAAINKLQHDGRITRVGRILRRTSIDELPQLWNVLKGDMQLIGARPEVPSMVDNGDPLWQAVLSEKPGLSDVATLVFRSEQELLAQFTDPDRAYREEILPQKLRLSAAYMSRRSLAADCRLLMLTVRYSLLPSNFDQARILKLLAGAQD